MNAHSVAVLTSLGLLSSAQPIWAEEPPVRRNLVLFVADGLRPGSINEHDAPAMARLQAQGVQFTNSHSLFPTFTTPNAAAIATGHYVGDTGDFGNGVYTDYRLFNFGNFGRPPATSTPFIENDPILGDLDDHFEGNYLGEGSLLAAARAAGYSTAAIGKLGPVAIQDVGQLAPRDGKFAVPDTIIIDDSTGTPDGVPLSNEITAALKKAGVPLTVPVRVQPSGDQKVSGTRFANTGQQVYFIEATTRVVLPMFRDRHRPFALVYWSRDPDGTQHNQGDSRGRLNPGINGPTSRAAVKGADENLQQILDYLYDNPELAANTDVVITSDHGFATISKHEVNATHQTTTSFAAQAHYDDVPMGYLPAGFLAIDLAEFLHAPLFDPDSVVKDAHGSPVYQLVRPMATALTPLERQHPILGNGLIGGSGRPLDHTDANVVVAVNGGSDLIYLPQADVGRVRAIVQFLATQDYVGALFVDDQYGELPGALPLSRIALLGASKLPRPAVVVSFTTFALPAKEASTRDPLLNAVQIADTPLQEGQGMHGSFGRDNTFNVMAAVGPDFKTKYRDPFPVSNADIAPTIAKLLGLSLTARGSLTGRVLDESLKGGTAPVRAQRCLTLSEPAANGQRTILTYQRLADRLYLDQAEFRRATEREKEGCR